ncbi:MAG TPA: nitrogenase component 1, partial [Clostridia bacterium]
MNNRNFVNLNINPCKMCMPMGAVMAFKGIENAMMILHGSQGCSTYIRRHMAGHYNEPVDVASSSLNENGTVFGGEKNLKKGLMNIIKQYGPEVVGIATTCLAETIGEDIERIAREFKNESDLGGVKVIPVSSPGYGGTQFEGYYTALCSIVKTLATDTAKNGKINIITSNQSPGDVRNIKAVLDMFGVEYIILPDVSDTLDAPYKKDYKRIPEGGTPIAEIAKMAGAAATIEIGMTIDESISPGEILNRKFGVPLYRCPLPVGIESSDRFIKLISEVSGKPVPKELEKQRGRYIDTMIDSHKINGEGRAVIFGEPEMVYAMTKLCFENGIKPLIVSTGSKNEKLQKLIEAEAEEMPQILVDTDFETIESLAGKLNANILIGNSDGKVITEHLGIPLVRVGFPIHDRMGGQRQVNTFYNGGARLLDEISNTLLESKHSGYRKRMFDSFYQDDNKNQEPIPEKKELPIEKKTKEHPCFGEMGCKNARMHIPVAPACNVSCNYCNRKYDCMNESRPGVTSEVLSPKEAAAKFIKVKERYDNLKVVGIAGPGDALANIEKTIESIKLIKEVDPDITFCLSTNGLMLPYYANELVDLGVTHFTVT